MWLLIKYVLGVKMNYSLSNIEYKKYTITAFIPTAHIITVDDSVSPVLIYTNINIQDYPNYIQSWKDNGIIGLVPLV